MVEKIQPHSLQATDYRRYRNRELIVTVDDFEMIK